MASAEHIATLSISRRDAVDMYFSREYLYKTQKRADGPLHRIIEWIKSETLYFFDLKHMTLGKAEDDYIFLYYHDGVRYKLDRNGRAVVSSADADDMMESVEGELQALIDSILADEMTASLRGILKEIPNTALGKSKRLANEDGLANGRVVQGVKIM